MRSSGSTAQYAVSGPRGSTIPVIFTATGSGVDPPGTCTTEPGFRRRDSAVFAVTTASGAVAVPAAARPARRVACSGRPDGAESTNSGEIPSGRGSQRSSPSTRLTVRTPWTVCRGSVRIGLGNRPRTSSRCPWRTPGVKLCLPFGQGETCRGRLGGQFEDGVARRGAPDVVPQALGLVPVDGAGQRGREVRGDQNQQGEGGGGPGRGPQPGPHPGRHRAGGLVGPGHVGGLPAYGVRGGAVVGVAVRGGRRHQLSPVAQGHGRVGAAQGDPGDDGERQGGDVGEQQGHLAEGQFDEDRRDGPGRPGR
ncbi:hypothetical protein STANM309S_00578 [Streptomyces tanashiensis]